MSTLHTINNWSVTLILGLLTALAIIRNFPNVISYALLIVGTSLVLRFFVRSMLAYTNLERFNQLQAAALKALQSDDTELLNERLARLYHRWACPVSRSRLIWSVAKLGGFTYLFAALLAVTVGAGLMLREAWQAQLLSVFGSAILAGEAFLFFNSPYFRYEPPPNDRIFGPVREQPVSTHECWRAVLAKARTALPAVLYWIAILAALGLVIAFSSDEIWSAVEDAWDSEPQILP